MFIKEEPVSNFANGLFFHLKCVKERGVASGGEYLFYRSSGRVIGKKSYLISAEGPEKYIAFVFGDENTMPIG